MNGKVNHWSEFLAWAITESGGKVGPQHNPYFGKHDLEIEAMQQKILQDLYRVRRVASSR